MALWKRILLRSTGFGAGFALVIVSAISLYSWRSSRPKEWSSTAITARPTQLEEQTSGEDVHFLFRYALTNNTANDYRVVAPSSGVLMEQLAGDASLLKAENASWDGDVQIPARQSVNVVFDVTVHLSDYNTTAEKLAGPNPNQGEISEEYSRFLGKRLKEINGLVLLDYSNRYRIELPENWNNVK